VLVPVHEHGRDAWREEVEDLGGVLLVTELDDQAIDPPLLAESCSEIVLRVEPLGATEEHDEVGSCGTDLDPSRDLGEDRVIDVGNEERYCAGALEAKCASGVVLRVAEVADCPEDALACVPADAK
jgi:hypothetical protein